MALIFITGGVRSGKSHFAEQAALQQYEAQACTAKRLLYLASGIALDHEMEKESYGIRQIARHSLYNG